MPERCVDIEGGKFSRRGLFVGTTMADCILFTPLYSSSWTHKHEYVPYLLSCTGNGFLMWAHSSVDNAWSVYVASCVSIRVCSHRFHARIIRLLLCLSICTRPTLNDDDEREGDTRDPLTISYPIRSGEGGHLPCSYRPYLSISVGPSRVYQQLGP